MYEFVMTPIPWTRSESHGFSEAKAMRKPSIKIDAYIINMYICMHVCMICNVYVYVYIYTYSG